MVAIIRKWSPRCGASSSFGRNTRDEGEQCDQFSVENAQRLSHLPKARLSA